MTKLYAKLLVRDIRQPIAVKLYLDPACTKPEGGTFHSVIGFAHWAMDRGWELTPIQTSVLEMENTVATFTMR